MNTFHHPCLRALPEATRIPCLPSRVAALKLYASGSCHKRKHLTSIARMHQPSWHNYHQSRQLSLRASTIRSSYGRNQTASAVHLSYLMNLSFQRCTFSSVSRASGTTQFDWNNRKSSNQQVTESLFISHQWKNGDKSNHFSYRDLTIKSDGTQSPFESIDVMKSKIQSEIDSDIQDTGKLDTLETKSCGSIQKTEDDFAVYLNGEEVALDGDTGLVVKKQNFAKNELDRTSKSLPILNEEKMTSSLDPVVSEESKIDDNDTSIESTEQNPNISIPSSNINYQYIFTPKDATLSGRERYEHRRRAMEQKLEQQQAQSRAATYSNVQRALAGNSVIALAKLAAAISSGSSAMMSEFVHSVVDCGNQTLLLVGLKSSGFAPDRAHPYGYGKAIYFWALVSALGTFFLGAGVSMTHSVGELIDPHMTTEVPWEVWGVLGMSFTVDGYVFWKTIQGVMASKRIDGACKQMSFWKYATTKVRDPATLAVLLEDGAACIGVLIAIGGIGLTQYTGMPVCDAVAGMGISALLGVMGLALVQVNHRFLIGQGLDKATRIDIERIILSRKSIDNIYSVQSQWTGPDTFSYKAEVDFDGTFLAAKLMPRYQQEFFDAKDTLDRDLHVLLSWYAEDIMRAAEREIRHIEEEIRTKYPAAQYIELEPMSKDADRYAINDGMEAQLRRVEAEVLNQYLKSLYKVKEDRGDKE